MAAGGSDHRIIYLIHTLFVAPLFVYVGLAGSSVPEPVFAVLGALGAGIFFYHAYLAFIKIREGKSAWVNWIHIFLVAPLLMLLARYKKDASRRYFEMLLLLGFAAFGYHGMYLVRESLFQ
jgi:hypothetical protein